MSSGIDREGAFKRVFEFVYKSGVRGSYAEFGVWQGASLIRALRQNKNWSTKFGTSLVDQFYAFDSFQGLPGITDSESLDNYHVFEKGQFSDTSSKAVEQAIEKAGLSDANLTLFPGFFEDTLQSHEVNELIEAPIAVAHIDCDLESSALLCLDFLEHRLTDGAILMFDDWFCYRGRRDKGVRNAFSIWSQKSEHEITEYFRYSWAGVAFITNCRSTES